MNPLLLLLHPVDLLLSRPSRVKPANSMSFPVFSKIASSYSEPMSMMK
jgi:hypothetical protein